MLLPLPQLCASTEQHFSLFLPTFIQLILPSQLFHALTLLSLEQVQLELSLLHLLQIDCHEKELF